MTTPISQTPVQASGAPTTPPPTLEIWQRELAAGASHRQAAVALLEAYRLRPAEDATAADSTAVQDLAPSTLVHLITNAFADCSTLSARIDAIDVTAWLWASGAIRARDNDDSAIHAMLALLQEADHAGISASEVITRAREQLEDADFDGED